MPDISLQHMIAVMLLDKTASFAAAHDNTRMKDAQVLRERAKVTLIADAELDKLRPKRVAIVELTMTDGSRRQERVENVRGTVENPMTREEVIAKARDLMAPVIGASKTQKLIQGVMQIEQTGRLSELTPLLQVG